MYTWPSALGYTEVYRIARGCGGRLRVTEIPVAMILAITHAPFVACETRNLMKKFRKFSRALLIAVVAAMSGAIIENIINGGVHLPWARFTSITAVFCRTDQ